LHECRFCHKILAAELVSKEQVDAHGVKILGPPPPTMVNPSSPFPPARTIPLRTINPPDIEPTGKTEEFVTYKLVYRCKYCGKEWSKISKKEYDIPQDETD
jgi:hypothetical protein